MPKKIICVNCNTELIADQTLGGTPVWSHAGSFNSYCPGTTFAKPPEGT